MSERYPGGYITKNAPQPTGGESGVADGVWTLEQALEYKQAGNWPIPIQPVYVEDVFSTYIYTGNNSTQTINNGINLSGKGGLVWGKARNISGSHYLVDTARGAAYGIRTNTTGAQTISSSTEDVTSFNSNGFSLGTGNNSSINNSGEPTVAWTFRKQPKFFDVVTWTGNNTAERAIPHNLGSVPGCIIVKAYTGSFANLIPWIVYHRSLPITSGYPERLELNSTGTSTPSTTVWGSTAFTSTNFYIGSDDVINNSNKTYVAYVFAHDAGGFGELGTEDVISCGSFTTNSTGNATINLGYEPQFLLMKNTTSAWNWFLFDTMRGWDQVGAQYLHPNLSNAETSNTGVGSPTATGFTVSGFGNTQTHIYIAIRRGPMKTPTDATTVFDADAWTGNNTAGRNIPTGFPVDLTIAQIRTAIPVTQANLWWDRLRGYGSTSSITGNYLRSQNTDAEFPLADYMYIPTMDGFNFGSVANNSNQYNSPDVTAVGWNFRRAPKFFDVVCFNGTGSQSIGIAHNLTVAPELIIEKPRNNIADWWVQHIPSNKVGNLQSNAAMTSLSGGGWVSPTSTLFYSAGFSTSWTEVAYLFATLSGVSKVGTYTGTGTTQQINCGFTGGARFVLIKRADSTGDWYVWDSARGIVAGNDPYLLLNSTAAEVTNTDYVDTYSAGFEISSTAPAAINANGGTFIYLAVA